MHKERLRINKLRKKRALRVRKHLNGSASMPRICVYRSNRNLTAQLIDDVNHVTLASVSSLEKEVRSKHPKGKNKDVAKMLGQKIAELAKAKNIEKAVFDRGPYRYHGIIAEFAESARSAGLKF